MVQWDGAVDGCTGVDVEWTPLPPPSTPPPRPRGSARQRRAAHSSGLRLAFHYSTIVLLLHLHDRHWLWRLALIIPPSPSLSFPSVPFFPFPQNCSLSSLLPLRLAACLSVSLAGLASPPLPVQYSTVHLARRRPPHDLSLIIVTVQPSTRHRHRSHVVEGSLVSKVDLTLASLVPSSSGGI